MRWFSLLAGLWMMTLGVFALFDADLATHACWFVAGLVTAAGASGLVVAFRSSTAG